MKIKSLRYGALALVLLAGGCASASDSATAASAKTALATALTAYADVFQPAILVYGRLPRCPSTTPLCGNQSIVDKLKAADAAVTAAANAAQPIVDGKAPDGGQIMAAMAAINSAEVSIASSGALAAPK